MKRIEKIIPGILLMALLLLSSCIQPIHLNYVPEENGAVSNQYKSTLRFGFVTFEDDRMIQNGVGMPKMIGWGTDSYFADQPVTTQIAKAFVEQYHYLGFHAVWIPMRKDFSISSRESLRRLRSKYPDINVFVIGKIRDYQFQLNHSGFLPGFGTRFIQCETKLEGYYIDAETGRVIFGATITHKSRVMLTPHHSSIILSADKLEGTLQATIMDFADRSIPHLSKQFPGAIVATNREMPAGFVNPLAPPAAVSSQKPIPSGNGRLIVSTTPGGSNIYIDGVYYGTSPLVLELSPGVHLLKVQLKGYLTIREKVGILLQKVTTWKRQLDKNE